MGYYKAVLSLASIECRQKHMKHMKKVLIMHSHAVRTLFESLKLDGK
jgi:hypothetical protein